MTIQFASSTQLKLTAILENPNDLAPSTVELIVQDESDLTSYSLAELCTILLVAPALSRHVPISFLEKCRHQFTKQPSLWQSLALLMLHGDDADRVAAWLQEIWGSHFADSDELLLQHLCHWFPEKIQTLPGGAKRKRSPIILSLSEGMRRAREKPYETHSDNILAAHFRNTPRLLIVQNIADNQGDEILRVHPILQAFLDAYPQLEATLLTHRWYLYDHARVNVHDISDLEFLKESLSEQWDGVIVFFEPYLATSSYNIAAQGLLQKYMEANDPPLFLWARKDVNWFVFESLVVNGEELASKLGINKRLLPLNYDATMRLIECLGLPLRLAEDAPLAGSVAACHIPKEISEEWHSLKDAFKTGGRESVALVNIFGGSEPYKGFTEASFDQLPPIMKSLVDEGYGLLVVSNGESWGSQEKIQEILNLLDDHTRNHTIALPNVPNAQENMRRIKHFVAASDLIVTIEGWMMHLAYLLGKRFRVLVASCSGPWEWFPIVRSLNQRRWIPSIETKVRNALTLNQPDRFPQIHFPEKFLLQAAFKVWSHLEANDVDPMLSYWNMSEDWEIRKWVVASRAEISSSHYRAEIMKALDDRDHIVRGTAATALLNDANDLSSELSQEWKEVLQAYQLLSTNQFSKARAIGAPALRALRACLTSDEYQIRRDAKITLESMNQSVST